MTRSNAPHTPARYILQVVMLAALYYSAGQFSFSLAVSHNIVTLVVFIAEGISLAATIGVLASGILWSLWKTRNDKPEPAPMAAAKPAE